jgi:putative phosphoesterase
MVTVAIVSDTHVPSRASRIPTWVRQEMAAADHVVHAGDFDSKRAIETVERHAEHLTAVRGNVDPGRLDFPTVDTLTVEGVEFVVTHGDGSMHDYRERVIRTVRREANDPASAVGVSGHTHEVHDEVVGEIHLLNPGSATAASPAPAETMLVADVERGDLDVTHRER